MFLHEVFSNKVYDLLLMTNYDDGDELSYLRQEIFHWLGNYSPTCLCPTMSNLTMLDYTQDGPYEIIRKQMDFLVTKQKFKSFSGIPPNHQSRWYHEAELCICTKCEAYWFVVFEESFCDYYLVRLSKKESDAMLDQPNWPNRQWLKYISDWDNFLKNDFRVWHHQYLAKSYDTYQNVICMQNFDLRY